MKTKSIFLLTFLLAACLANAQNYIPLQQHMQGVSGAEKITNLAEVEADLGRFTNLSATTGILSTANAQTLNVTGNTTVNGFNYTASPTLNGASSTESTSTSVIGGIWNGDFSEGEGAISYNSAYINDTLLYTSASAGTLGSTSISNNTLILNATYGDEDSAFSVLIPHSSVSQVYIKIKPSTSYKLSCKYKIESVSTTGTSPYIAANGVYYSNNSIIGYQSLFSGITENTDWTTASTTFTSRSDSSEFKVSFYAVRMQAKLTIDDIKLEQVTTHTNNSTTPTVAYPVITGVSSEFVDQQQVSQDGTLAFGDISGTEYWRRQTFTPTKSKLSSITLQKYSNVGTPAGNVILEIRNPANAIIASVDVEKAIWDAIPSLTDYTVTIFALLEENTSGYQILLRSDANEASNSYYRVYAMSTGGYSGGSMGYSINSGSSWTDTAQDIYFKTRYAENTRQITLTNSSTGTSTTVDWGDDGLPDGAVVDLYNGTMSWSSSLTPIGRGWVSIVYAADITDGYSTYNSNRIFSGAALVPTNGAILQSQSMASKYIYFKIPSRYINTINLSVKFYSQDAWYVFGQYSWDGSNWITFQPVPSTNPDSTVITKTYLLDNYNNSYLYLRLSGGDTKAFQLMNLSFTATLDTSAIAPLLLAAGSNTINQSVNGGSYKANVAIKSVSGGFQTTLNEANKQLAVLRNAPSSYLETPDKTQNAVVIDNDGMASMIGPIQVNGATIMNASITPAYDIALPYNSGGAIGSSWNTYSETKYKNIISDVTEASYANIASRLAGVQSKMVTRKIPDAVKAKFFDAEIEWVTDVVSVTEELKTQVVEPVYEAVKMDSKVTLDSKATEEQLLTDEADRKIVSYVTKEVSVLRSPGEYPRQEFRGWKIRHGVDEATKKQLENLYFKPHPEPIADTAPEAYRVPEGFAWSKWVEESTIYQNWILPQIINEIPQLRKRLEALEASK